MENTLMNEETDLLSIFLDDNLKSLIFEKIIYGNDITSYCNLSSTSKLYNSFLKSMGIQYMIFSSKVTSNSQTYFQWISVNKMYQKHKYEDDLSIEVSMFYIAAGQGYSELMKKILEIQENTNNFDSKTINDLFVLAVHMYHPNLISILTVLLEYAANINSKVQGYCALNWAIYHSATEVIKFLLKNAATVTEPILISARINESPLMELLEITYNSQTEHNL